MFALQHELFEKFDENFKKRFFDTFEFFKHGINEYILLLQKDGYSK